MAGYQFIHINTYARKARPPRIGKNGERIPGKRSARSILSEAARLPGYHPHVRRPEAPLVLVDDLDSNLLANPLDLLPEIEQGAERARDPLGRKLRVDAQLLLAGVISYPISMVVLNSDAAQREQCDKWFFEVTGFLKQEIGKQLRCVVRHIDESRLHLHFYASPDFAAGHSSLDYIHPGRKASAAAAPKSDRSAAAKTLRDEAYCAAMRALQDRFYESVGMHFGHARLGPRKRHLSRAEWRAEQAQAEALLRVKREAESALEAARISLRSIAAERDRALAEIGEIKATAARQAQAYISKLRYLSDLLLGWVQRMERHSVSVPNELRDVLRVANDALDSHGP